MTHWMIMWCKGHKVFTCLPHLFLLTCLFRSSMIRAIWIFFLPILANFWGLPLQCLLLCLCILHSTFWSFQTCFFPLLSPVKNTRETKTWGFWERLCSRAAEKETNWFVLVWLWLPRRFHCREINGTGIGTDCLDYPPLPCSTIPSKMECEWVSQRYVNETSVQAGSDRPLLLLQCLH